MFHFPMVIHINKSKMASAVRIRKQLSSDLGEESQSALELIEWVEAKLIF